jgi:hypothetical protein
LSSEKGNSIIEFVFCFPFVLLVFVCSIDLGRALNSYFTITRVVYEGARYAGQVGALEVAAPDSAASALTYPGHIRVRNRVDLLLIRYDINPSNLPADYLKTERITYGPGATRRDEVRITLKIPFQPIFPMFQGVLNILGTRATGPYLFMS